MYVVLSKTEKYVPYGEMVGTTECLALQMRRRKHQSRCNRVQLYFWGANCSFCREGRLEYLDTEDGDERLKVTGK